MTHVSQIHTTNDVLVVGAGPVGLTLTNDLLRRGIRCRLIDSAPHASQKTKALGIHAKTLELLAKMGVAHTAIERGLTSPGFSLYSDGKRITRISFGEYLLDTPYPYVLMLPQYELEQLLTEHLQSQHSAIEWQSELIGITQDEQGVEVVVRRGDGKIEQLRVCFVVGCDGAHSAVRHLLGLHFAGTTFEQSFAVGNVRVAWELPYNEIVACVHRGNFIAYFPMADGRHRVVIAYELEKTSTEEVTLEEIQRVIDLCGPVGTHASEPTDLTRFHVNQRRAEQYRCGRVFLAGDAAHIHSPIGAQGMNTGIQDALNLSWKLALTVKGLAAPGLLESYEVEREQVGEALLRGTERATRMALTRHPLLLTLRNTLAPIIFSTLPGAAHRLAEALSEISIAYPHSPIVVDSRDKKGTLHAGDRAPNALVRLSEVAEPQPFFDLLNSERSILLVLVGQQKASEFEGQWHEIESLLAEGYDRVIEAYLVTEKAPSGSEQVNRQILYDFTGELHRRYEAEQGGVILIRPDGYIGFWEHSGVPETLRTYVQTLFCQQKERPTA